MKRKLNDNPRATYCFTFNNYTEAAEAALRDWLTKSTKYAVFGHEIAPTTGTPHLQGYFSLLKKARTGTIQKQLTAAGIKMSLIHAKGSPQQNRVYCLKVDPNGYFEHGNIATAGAGARSDLAGVVEDIQLPLCEIAAKHPVEFIKYSRGIEQLKNILTLKDIPADRDITVTVYFGTGGTGKTSKAHEDAKRLKIELYLLSPPTGGSQVWWNDYHAERGLLIDDFYGWLQPHYLYRVLDRKKFQIYTKFGHTYANWDYVWITSNVSPEKFYKAEVMMKLDDEAYNRRFHNIYQMEYWDFEKTAVAVPKIEKETKKIRYLPFESATPAMTLGNQNIEIRTEADRMDALGDSDYITDTGPDIIPSPPAYDSDDGINDMYGVD